jgi:23S rRNA (uridine2552-2'-O)-methyltransferase
VRNSILLDLGASPGSWSQIASRLAQKVIAIDLLEMAPIQNVDFIQGDFLDLDNIKIIKQMLDGNLFDVILSDMAPNTCGIKKIDHLRIMNLIEEVFEFCKDNLKIGGHVVTKTFQGGTENNLMPKLKNQFEKVIHFKPNSSRKESKEVYLIALGFR